VKKLLRQHKISIRMADPNGTLKANPNARPYSKVDEPEELVLEESGFGPLVASGTAIASPIAINIKRQILMQE